MIKEIFYYLVVIFIFLIGIALFSYIAKMYQINIYVLVFFYVIFSAIIFIFERKFFNNEKFFTIFFIIQFLLLIFIFKFQFKYFKNVDKNESNNSKVIFQQKSVFQSEEEKYKYNYGTIEEKIIILKNMGLSKQEVYNKLENNTEFRTLIKDNQNKFDEIFQKEN